MSDFASHTDIKWTGNVGTVEYGGGDRGMVVMFYTRPIPNAIKSRENGRPYFDNKTFVRIHPPGERFNIIDREVTDSDKRRWPMQWQQFRENRQQMPEGTPIDLLYPDNPAVAATMRANSVHTVEQCAELSGPAIDSIGMGCQRYVNDAKKYLEMAHKGVKATQLRHELEERDSQIRTLNHKIEMLTAEVERLRQEGPTGNLDLEQLQRIIATAQGRPQYPTNKNLDKAFDVQSVQINATHPTADATRQRKRQRARITG